MSNKLQELKKKLSEIFQLDQTDLDFGIYRVLNQKAEEVNEFLDKKLLNQVKESFSSIENEGQSHIKTDLDKLVDTLKSAGMNPDDSPKVQELKKQLSESVDITALENEVFSHLTSFFSRYYKEGDFLSLRRYKKDVYAIPYEGEEVKLHWANSDQYYIKSSENFKDYSFKISDGKTVHFKIVDAETEKDNNKAQSEKERSFILNKEKPLFIENNELFIRFNYKSDTENKKQPKHNEEAIDIIKNSLTESEFLEYAKLLDLNPTEKNKKRTVLEKHLNDYTSKNSFDYFIHKDLGGFLRRELDFYIKNEIMFIDDLDENNIKYSIKKVKVIKNIANKIISFLEQLENFQKKLWLKKKFVVESEYCVTLDKVPVDLYPEIIKNKEQIQEWQNLFVINEIEENLILNVVSGNVLFNDNETSENKIKFLNNNPFLVLDTKFFSKSFKEKLLESIHNLDENTDGLMINSDNFHALNLLQEKYREKIKCVYIDPPYNTDSAPIAYKNNYKDSSWISLIHDRVLFSKNLISENGIIITAIDDIELRYLTTILDSIMGKENYISLITTLCNPQGRVANYVSKTSEYHLLYAKKLELMERIFVDKINNKREWTPFKRTGTNSRREDRPLRYFPLLQKNNELSLITDEEYNSIYNKNTKQFNDDYLLFLEKNYKDKGYNFIFPIKEDGTKLVWQREYKRTAKEIKNYSIKNGTVYTPGFEEEIPKTCWIDSIYANPEYGTELVKNILGNSNLFGNTAKSLYTVKQLTKMNDAENILDFFAGSGTTGHAVIELNREDEGTRKYTLVEMGEYFDTVTKPRIQKVIYSKDWKDGKPISRKGSSHIFKYIKLESYEDALNNLKQKDTKQIKMALENASDSVNEKYMLSYMMDFEYGDSLLNVDIFNNPFDYKMNISNGTETKIVNADLIETFNYLIGLNIRTIYNSNGFKVIEGYNRKEENILIIWRNIEEKSNNDLDELFKKLRVNPRDYEFDRIYVNGDNNLDNLKLDSDSWKVTLIEEEFKKRMFDVQDI